MSGKFNSKFRLLKLALVERFTTGEENYEWFECVQCNYSELGCNENVCPYRLEQFKKWCKKQKLKGKCNENCIHKKDCV